MAGRSQASAAGVSDSLSLEEQIAGHAVSERRKGAIKNTHKRAASEQAGNSVACSGEQVSR